MINKCRFVPVLMLFLLLTGCVSQLTTTENLPKQLVDKATVQSTEIPMPEKTSSPAETEASTAILVVPTPEAQGAGNKSTY
ncbi:MAG: hypothetical protein PHS75_08290 [Anaerolineaceae bacterium]|jgi:PBP1b-binding outer membrane lipoprotein LpoB|nr:hypothetical protein [Anaerolineaceae bacterium]